MGVALRAALILVIAAATASAVRVSVSPTSLTIKEGFKQVITFKLDEPIICSQLDDRECSVVVKLTNSHPHQVSIDNCHVKWTSRQWHTPRYITVRASEDFVDDTESTYTLQTEVVESPSEYYNGFDPADITIKTEPRPSAVCSATGDPHYKTFDGHYYHIYAPGRVVFYKSTNPTRERRFEIQTDMYSFHRPAVHCAVAAREGDDVVVVSLCHDGHTVRYRRTCGSAECRAGQYPRVAITTGSNPSYVVDFASGARLTAQVHYWSAIGKRYINVYATAPGVDYSNTAGVCGNNDGNRNNDVSVAYNGWIHNLANLYESQRPTENLFNWYPSGVSVAPTLPPFAEECDYVDPIYVRPVLGNPDVEDITNLIKQALPEEEENFQGINFEDDGEDLPAPVSRADAEEVCNRLRDTEVAKACLDVFPGFNMDGFLEQCVEDVMVTGGDPDFLAVAVDALEAQCADNGNRDLNTWETDNNGNPVEPNMELQDAMCPNGCSGNGVCKATKCECNAPFTGVDCSIDPTSAPAVSAVSPPLCDRRHLKPCPEEVTVRGSGFYKSDNLACRFGGDTITKARFLGALEIFCEVPANIDAGGTAVSTHTVEVTTDGQQWSPVTAASRFSFYDSVCKVCTPDNFADGCADNDMSCTIDGTCYLDTQSHPDNVCRRCHAEEDATGWSFVKDNSGECGPQFDTDTFTARIISEGAAGDELITFTAVNDRVKDDPDAAVTYSLQHQAGDEGITSRKYLQIDPATGVVTLKEDIKVTEALLLSWHPVVHVLAEDKVGRVGSASLYVEAWETNEGPVFSQDPYRLEVQENTAPGSVVGQLTATDENSGSLGSVRYSWLQQEAGAADAFVLDAATGEITVGLTAPDYEARASHHLIAKAQDGGGQYRTVDVFVTIVNVNEAPTDVAISPAAVEENAPVGTVVGRLTASDPDADDTFTFALVGGSSDVKLAADGVSLVSLRVFDAEAEDAITVTVRATDAGGLATQTALTIAITNVNEPPHSIALSETTFAENARGVLATLTVEDDDAEDVVRCALTQTDGGRFELSGSSTQQLVLRTELDFETVTGHTIEVTCEDLEGLRTSKTFMLTIRDAAEAPEAIALAQPEKIKEDAAAGTVVGTVSALDKDANAGPIVFSVDGAGEGVFAIGAASCAMGSDSVQRCSATVTVAVAGVLDYDASPTAGLTVRAQDSTGLSAFKQLEVALENVNEPPTGLSVAGKPCAVQENAADESIVCQIVVNDPDADDVFDFSLTGADGAAFKLTSIDDRRRRRNVEDARTAILRVADGSAIDFESSNGQLTLTVRVTDAAGLTADLPLEVTVQDEPRTVVFADTNTHYAFVDEDAAQGASLGALSVRGLDTAGAVAQFTLSEDNVAGQPFAVSGGQLVVSGPLDAETRSAYLVNVRATFTGAELPPVETLLTVTVNDVDEAPVFVDAPSRLTVNSDLSTGTTLLTLTAKDPENAAVTLALTADATGLLQLTSAGALRLTRMPSAAGLALGEYTVVVTASSTSAGDADGVLTLTLQLVDDCHVDPCNGNGECTDAGINAFRCDCVAGKAGDTCDEDGLVFASESDKGAAAGATAGIVVGVLCALLVVLVVVAIVLRRRRDQRVEKEALAWTHAEQGVFDNPTFVAPSAEEPMYASTDDSYFAAGVANPMYAWYRPELARQEATEELLGCPEGAFVIRDSQATPGWHMLGVRTADAVVHDKIRRDENGMYELLPSTGNEQPRFEDLPSLVQFYGVPRASVGYVLDVSSFSNPMYAMGQQAQAGHYHSMWHRDEAAPVVPLKERERADVARVATLAEEDLYTNTAEAHAALNRSDTSA